MKTNNNTRRGFTLIELLIGVLIIGILAAVALPQYNAVVLKTKYAHMITLGESFKSAQERYYLAEGTYSPSIRNLDINITGEEVIEPFSNNEAYKIDDLYVFSSASQIATYLVDKENNLSMMYNLCLDNQPNHCNWQGAHSLCRAYDRTGEAGRKICNSLPGAFNCETKTAQKYYQCFGR